ncbi:MAG: hypothetical protein JWN70_3847 [Planctomycetaceae bacterium]|nr:hypothetical protein [Planctomycetaceae bacterium]
MKLATTAIPVLELEYPISLRFIYVIGNGASCNYHEFHSRYFDQPTVDFSSQGHDLATSSLTVTAAHCFQVCPISIHSNWTEIRSDQRPVDQTGVSHSTRLTESVD